jgi:GNAT superfamily N-acetyltransferase
MDKKLTFKELENILFLFELIEQSFEWKIEEFDENPIKISDVEKWMKSYDNLNGRWRVWNFNNVPIGVTFHIQSAPFNQKPWLGAILIKPVYRRKGYARLIIDTIRSELYDKGNKVLYAGVPFKQIHWGIFLGKCGFEQIGVQEDGHKSYTVLGLALE